VIWTVWLGEFQQLRQPDCVGVLLFSRLSGEMSPLSSVHRGLDGKDQCVDIARPSRFSAYCRERALFPEQMEYWWQAATDGTAKPVLTMTEQKDLQKLRA